MPEGAWSPVGWESDTRVVFEIRGEPSRQGLPTVERLARCDVIEVTCTLIEDHPVGPMVWPEAGAWS